MRTPVRIAVGNEDSTMLLVTSGLFSSPISRMLVGCLTLPACQEERQTDFEESEASIRNP